jgi:hypothetical protein
VTVDGRPLFRPEAVEYHERGRTETRPLNFGSGRTAWFFRAIAMAVAICVALGLTLHADVSARGTGIVRDDGVTARLVLPIGAINRLRAGQAVRIDVGRRDARGHVTRVGNPETTGVPVLVALDAPAPAQAHGLAIVRLGRPTLAGLLLGRHGG